MTDRITTDEVADHVVNYKVEGFGKQSAGPYTRDEAERHADDIRGFEGVSSVWIQQIATAGCGGAM